MIELEISFEDFLEQFRKIVKQLDAGQIRYLLDEIEQVHPTGPAHGDESAHPAGEGSEADLPPLMGWAVRSHPTDAPAADPWGAASSSYAAPEVPAPPALEPVMESPVVPDVTFAPSVAEGSEWFKQLTQLFDATRGEATRVPPEELDSLIRRSLEEVSSGGTGPVR